MFGFQGPLSACKPWFVMYFPCQIWRFSHLVCSPTKGLRQHHWLHPNSTSKQSGLNGKKRDLWSSEQSNQEPWNAQQSHKHRKQYTAMLWMLTATLKVLNPISHFSQMSKLQQALSFFSEDSIRVYCSRPCTQQRYEFLVILRVLDEISCRFAVLTWQQTLRTVARPTQSLSEFSVAWWKSLTAH